jgi:hypothetical protein
MGQKYLWEKIMGTKEEKINNPFLTAMQLQHYLGKLFVAYSRLPIEVISDGKKTTSVLTGN